MNYVVPQALNLRPQLIRVPVYSQIAAGTPFYDTNCIGHRWIPIPKGYRKGHRLCAVRVYGDSLVNAAIISGDYAICRLTSEVERNGQLAAVMIQEGLTLKYVHVETSGGLWLRAANPRVKDRYFSPGEAFVQAVVMTIERDL